MLKSALLSAAVVTLWAATPAAAAQVLVGNGTKAHPQRILAPGPVKRGYRFGCYGGRRYVRDGVNGWMSWGGGCKNGDQSLE